MESSESVVGLCDDEGACVERGEGLCMLNGVFGERRCVLSGGALCLDMRCEVLTRKMEDLIQALNFVWTSHFCDYQ